MLSYSHNVIITNVNIIINHCTTMCVCVLKFIYHNFCIKFLDSKNNTCYLHNILIHGNCKYFNTFRVDAFWQTLIVCLTNHPLRFGVKKSLPTYKISETNIMFLKYNILHTCT